MARKGITLWEVSKTTEQEGYSSFPAYLSTHTVGLRDDGALVEKHSTQELDGSARHNYGWKRLRRANTFNATALKAALEVNGYQS